MTKPHRGLQARRNMDSSFEPWLFPRVLLHAPRQSASLSRKENICHCSRQDQAPLFIDWGWLSTCPTLAWPFHPSIASLILEGATSRSPGHQINKEPHYQRRRRPYHCLPTRNHHQTNQRPVTQPQPHLQSLTQPRSCWNQLIPHLPGRKLIERPTFRLPVQLFYMHYIAHPY